MKSTRMGKVPKRNSDMYAILKRSICFQYPQVPSSNLSSAHITDHSTNTLYSRLAISTLKFTYGVSHATMALPPGPPPPNFFDPKPLANHQSTILGITITLLVS
jgi:hypothetical protein